MRSNVRGMRPTRRGLAVTAVAIAAFLLGAGAGARSLNAVVVPALVGLLAGGIQLARADPPTVERSTPEAGFPGERRTLTLTVDADIPCRVSESVDDGIQADSTDVSVGHGGTFEYEIELLSRGEHTLGPATCRVTDSLGLFETELETTATATALVYPDVYGIDERSIGSLVSRALGDERSSFDRLREYGPGDTMRDIHWRASAKRPDEEFVVAEYQSRSEATRVKVVGESALGSADAMAESVASLVTHLHDAGVTATVTVPGGNTVAHPGDTRSVLDLLARTDDGWVEPEHRTNADMYVLGKGGRATVTLADREVDFDGLSGTHRGREVLP
jgi:uncharacterized protein (DUF58 family)